MKIALSLTAEEFVALTLASEARIVVLTGIAARTHKKSRAPIEARLQIAKALHAKISAAQPSEKENRP